LLAGSDLESEREIQQFCCERRRNFNSSGRSARRVAGLKRLSVMARQLL